MRASAGGIVIGPNGTIAIVQQHRNSWSFPKGGIEPGESALEAARREVSEETGLTELTHIADLGSYRRYSLGLDGTTEQRGLGLRKRTFFLFTTPQTQFHEHDPHHEITEVRWATLDGALALLTHEKDKAFLRRVKAQVERAIKTL